MRKLMAVLSFAAAMAGCRDAGPTGPFAAVAGTYKLTSVNAAPLPYTMFENASSRVEAIRGSLVLGADGSYAQQLDRRTVYSTGAFSGTTGTERGRYGIAFSQITFSVPPGGDMMAHSYSGTFSEGIVTVPIGNFVMRYEK